ncbi:MAG: VIT domain-containing protein [Bacteroidota bacterium]
MQKRILTAFACFIFTTASAQIPQLTVKDSTAKVYLQSLHINVKVTGTIASTTIEMVFYNTTDRILEGTLNFPLPEGISVSRYALDINGKMREAVAVDKTKGTQVFEAIERRRVDPGLLEKVDGNTFRTRIYPINPHNSRRIIIGYEEELGFFDKNTLRYHLPLSYKNAIDTFDLKVEVIQSMTTPLFEEKPDNDIRFDGWNNNYIASIHKTNFLPSRSLTFLIPKPVDATEVMIQKEDNHYYYLLNTFPKKDERVKPKPGTITILWDASLSRIERDTLKELALLNEYFSHLQNVKVSFVSFSNTILSRKNYTISNGNWAQLKKDIESIQYDGATQLGLLDLKKMQGNEFLLFSDGHSTFGKENIIIGNKPVYCITSSANADYSNLKFIAQSSGGNVINLLKLKIAEAKRSLQYQPLQFLGVKANDKLSENYPSLPFVINNNVSVAGISSSPKQQLILQYGFGKDVTVEKIIDLDLEKQQTDNVRLSKTWAQKKIAELDINYQQNKKTIEQLGNKYGIITRNTSLIVLELVSDYVMYEIEPPAELREQYDQMIKQRNRQFVMQQQQVLSNAANFLNPLLLWYGKRTIDVEQLNKQVKAIEAKKLGYIEDSSVITMSRNLFTDVFSRIKNGNMSADSVVEVIQNKAATNSPLQGMPGAGVNIRIRGNASITAESSPLYIIDGVAVENGLSSLVPQDIQSMDVLRDASATSIYGARAANGVVIINTKSNSGIANNADADRAFGKNQSLNEVVVVGYGTVRRRDLAGGVTSVSGSEIKNMAVNSAAEALQGRIAGVQVTTEYPNIVDGNTTITVRGVVDDVVYIDGVRSTVDDMQRLDVNDIESIEVQKTGSYIPSVSSSNFSYSAEVPKKKKGKKKAATIPPLVIADTIAEAITKDEQHINPDYIDSFTKSTDSSIYTKYLSQRKKYVGNPVYYFEVANYLFGKKQYEYAMRILSNMAEINAEDHELYKMLGYKLKQLGEYEYEIMVFKKVLQWRPMEPQSYRDYGLALMDGGYYQNALDTLYAALTKNYSSDVSGMYPGVEEIIITEINDLIALHADKLDLSGIPRTIIQKMPLDLRVVLNWNMNDTDIDLWVTDPDGEKCFYSHKNTAIGGRISNDFTRGYGPEQFLLKEAKKGVYTIQLNYYGNSQSKLAGPTTVMAEVLTNYGTAKQQRKIVTMQMEKGANGEVLVGRFSL